jgi:DnaJ-class molecular chaperone
MDGQGPKEPTLPDHYAILGIPQYATMAHIKTAYRKMVLTHHPDKMAPGQTVDATDFRRVSAIPPLRWPGFVV